MPVFVAYVTLRQPIPLAHYRKMLLPASLFLWPKRFFFVANLLVPSIGCLESVPKPTAGRLKWTD